MERKKRLHLMEAIEKERSSAVICYITGDRENLATRIAQDVMPIFYRHLEIVGGKDKIDLFLFTRGGDVLTPWRLVNLIREYTPYFSVLIPFRAYSAGTMVSLGANETVMGKMGELGPIDPSVANAFNPEDPNNPQAKVPVSVEDVVSYLGLAQERANLKEPQYLFQVFSLLADKVHPLALGNVHRNYSLIRLLARSLLHLHIKDNEGKETLVPQIIDYLTERLYAHNYMIPRQEARDEIKLNVIYPSEKLEQYMWQLYAQYEEELKLSEPFDASSFLTGVGSEVEFEVAGGVIESRAALDSFIFQGTVCKEAEGKVNVNIRHQGWRRII